MDFPTNTQIYISDHLKKERKKHSSPAYKELTHAHTTHRYIIIQAHAQERDLIFFYTSSFFSKSFYYELVIRM